MSNVSAPSSQTPDINTTLPLNHIGGKKHKRRFGAPPTAPASTSRGPAVVLGGALAKSATPAQGDTKGVGAPGASTAVSAATTLTPPAQASGASKTTGVNVHV